MSAPSWPWFVLALGACVHAPPVAATAPAGSEKKAGNIEFADYAGSDACDGCHHKLVERWRRTPMHNMTRVDGASVARAPFGDASLRLAIAGDLATLEAAGDERFVRVRSARFGDHVWRVTRVIGGHHREDYAGVEVATVAAGAPVVGDGRERVLPVSYMEATGGLRYKGYSVMSPERPGLAVGADWARTCIFCHNTVPWLSTALGALAAPRSVAYQGEQVDQLLPAGRRSRIEITDAAALARAICGEAARVGEAVPAGGVSTTAAAAALALRRRFTAKNLVETGIGCESCHGGCKAHVDDFTVRPRFVPTSPSLRIVESPVLAALPPPPLGPPPGAPLPAALQPDARRRAIAIDRVCARCHQVLFSRYPWTWEGGERRHGEPGGSHISSGEARDFLLGGCASAMSCVACHDPHDPDDKSTLARLETASGDAVCTGCHVALSDEKAARAHTHHDPRQGGARCLACHMPRRNMSLDSTLTRDHRIGSPDDAARVERDRPVECALCHADKTVGDLLDTMQRWWGRAIDRAAVARLYGSLDVRPIEATLAVGKPHERAVAVAIAGEAHLAGALPLVARELANPYPAVRFFARRAFALLAGAPCAIDVEAPVATIAAQAAACAPVPIAPAPAPRSPPAATGGDDED